MEWWQEGVLYQVYPRSFADSNGDGIGDLRGITARLDHLEWLGVAGIWISPTFPSPNADWGYDVSDYLGAHPDFGTLEDLDELIAEAGRREIRILLDLVPNHTSDQHAWFRDRPEYYVWADEIPNNWRSIFTGETAWREDSGRYYLAQFAPQQPDLDWWNPDVRAEFERILRFWFDRGVAGFRIDVANALIKDRELRDNTPAAPGDPARLQQYDSRFDRSANQPEVHEIYRRWREISDEYVPPRLLVGESYVTDVDELMPYYGDGTNELQLPFNFKFLHEPFEAEALRAVVEETEAALPPGAWPVWTASNHDAGRLATRWGDGDERKTRAALFLLLGLRGTPFIYFGDELALPDGAVAPERILDIADPKRDPGRTPMPWTDGDGGWRDPWLPLVDTSRNVEAQRADPDSTLNYVHELIEARRAFVAEPYASLLSRPGVWAWTRGATSLAVNLTDEPSEHDGRALEPWEGVVWA